MRLLLSKGLDPHQGDKGQKARPILWAMALGRIAMVDALIEHEPRQDRQWLRDDRGELPGRDGVSGDGASRAYPELMPKDGTGTGNPMSRGAPTRSAAMR